MHPTPIIPYLCEPPLINSEPLLHIALSYASCSARPPPICHMEDCPRLSHCCKYSICSWQCPRKAGAKLFNEEDVEINHECTSWPSIVITFYVRSARSTASRAEGTFSSNRAFIFCCQHHFLPSVCQILETRTPKVSQSISKLRIVIAFLEIVQ